VNEMYLKYFKDLGIEKYVALQPLTAKRGWGRSYSTSPSCGFSPENMVARRPQDLGHQLSV